MSNYDHRVARQLERIADVAEWYKEREVRRGKEGKTDPRWLSAARLDGVDGVSVNIVYDGDLADQKIPLDPCDHVWVGSSLSSSHCGKCGSTLLLAEGAFKCEHEFIIGKGSNLSTYRYCRKCGHAEG